jgi:hypothetical protein
MNWRQLDIPFEEFKDRQLTINFEEQIAEVLDKEDSYTDYDESDEDLDSEGDEDWYDPMLLDYNFNNGQINKS